MPRLLHIANYAPRGTRTFDHFILALARRGRQLGWDVRFAFNAEPPEAFRQQLAAAGASCVVIAFPFTRASAWQLLRKLGDFRPDLTQTSFLSAFTPALLTFKLLGRTRFLIVLDHSSGEGPTHRGLRRWVARLRGAAVGRVVDGILPVSYAIARRDVERVFLPANKIRVIYNGIRLDLFSSPPRERRETVRVVYAGQLIPEKGVETLLRAHDRLRRAGVLNSELVVAGRGPQEEQLKGLCGAAGRSDVTFLGHVDSVAGLFGSADVVVVPSIWYEAFGLVAAEAMACGAACVVSDAGSLPEVVGDAGLTFRAGDEAELAARLRELIEDADLRERLGRAARERVESLFSLDDRIERHLRVCAAVVAGRPLPTPYSERRSPSGSDIVRRSDRIG